MASSRRLLCYMEGVRCGLITARRVRSILLYCLCIVPCISTIIYPLLPSLGVPPCGMCSHRGVRICVDLPDFRYLNGPVGDAPPGPQSEYRIIYSEVIKYVASPRKFEQRGQTSYLLGVIYEGHHGYALKTRD